MASASLDSQAAFEERAKKIGINDDILEGLKDQGFDTYGKLAFAVKYNHQQADETVFVQFVNGLEPTGLASAGQLAAMRRLFFESNSMVIADIQNRVQTTADSSTSSRKLPVAERVSRQKDQEQRLAGVIFTPETTPANALVDTFVDMLEVGVLHYVKPEACCSRAQEAQTLKKDSTLSLDSSGNIKMASKASDLVCDTSSEIKLRAALQRRSLAMDLAGLATFTVMEGWVQFLFTKLMQETPKSFQRITLSQILECDKQLFTVASHRTMGILTASPDKSRPLDAIVEELRVSPEILHYLAPLQGNRGGSEPPTKKPRTDAGPPPKPKPKGGGKAAKKFDIPEGCVTHDDENRPFCFAYQFGKCKWKGEAGKRCARGFHRCFKRNCGKNAPYFQRTH